MAQYAMKHMKTFCSVVECGGFVSAQGVLGMSQPAISTHIRDFEIRLGFQLCHRGRSGFTLTEKGFLVYEKCRAMLNSVSDFEADLGELRNKLTGSLRLGLIDNTITNPDFPVTKAIRRFFARENDVSIKVEVLAPDALERELLNGSIHLALGPFQRKESSLNYQLLYHEKHKFYCAKEHPLFVLEATEISWESLQEFPVSSRAYLQSSDVPGIQNRAFVSNMEAQAMLINSGQFIGFLPQHYAQQWVDKGEMREIDHLNLAHESSFYLASRKSSSIPNVIKIFIDDLMNKIGEV
jgi:DNA-binding transcriptional LysR family regulator